MLFGLTREQRTALCVVLFLLLLGWAVKTWRTAHPIDAGPRPPGGEPEIVSVPVQKDASR